MGSVLGLGRSPGRRARQPTPVFLPGKFHQQRSLESSSPWGRKESDTTDRLSLHYIYIYIYIYIKYWGFPRWHSDKESWEDLLEKEMATHSSVLAWKIPWTEEPGGLQSIESQRVGHDWAPKTFTFTSIKLKKIKTNTGNSLAVQWLGLCFHCRGCKFSPWSGN